MEATNLQLQKLAMSLRMRLIKPTKTKTQSRLRDLEGLQGLDEGKGRSRHRRQEHRELGQLSETAEQA